MLEFPQSSFGAVVVGAVIVLVVQLSGCVIAWMCLRIRQHQERRREDSESVLQIMVKFDQTDLEMWGHHEVARNTQSVSHDVNATARACLRVRIAGPHVEPGCAFFYVKNLPQRPNVEADAQGRDAMSSSEGITPLGY